VGRFGHLYPHRPGVLGIFLQSENEAAVRIRRVKALRAGFEKSQWGDSEAVLLFRADDDHQVRLALRLAGIRRKKRASSNQLVNLRKGPATRPRQRLGAATSPETGVGHPKFKDGPDDGSLSETQVPNQRNGKSDSKPR
jgi:hypothetical protein